MGQLSPVELEEPNGSKKSGSEHRTDSEDFLAHDEPAKHLCVHALERVDAEDGLVGTGVHIVRIIRSGFELFAVVVACQHRPRQQTPWGLG